MNRSAPIRQAMVLLGALFVVSGATALLAEQVFEKLLSTVVGASTPAGALVLATYFLGLTLGGALYPLVGSLRRRPLGLYGRLEALAGVWSLSMAVGWSSLQTWSAELVHRAGHEPGAVFAARLAVSAVWILPPTMAMGMTFPAVVSALERGGASDRLPRAMAGFYALNLLGAFLGAAGGPYLLFPALGLRGTLLSMAAAQLAVAAAAIRLDGRIELADREAPVAGRRIRAWAALATRPGVSMLTALAFLSGLFFFSLEVTWTHLIGAVLGSSVYAFAIMLAVVLASLFVGSSAWAMSFGRRPTLPVRSLGVVLGISGVALALTVGGWDDAQRVMLHWPGVDSFFEGETVRLLLAAGLVGPPAIALGLVFPLLFRLPFLPREAGAASGLLVGSNALGSIVGALATGFWLLPRVGSEVVLRSATLLLGLLAIGVALAAWRRDGRRHGRFAVVSIALGLTAGLAAGSLSPWDPLELTSGINVYFRRAHVTPDSELLFWDEDPFGGFTTVVQKRGTQGAVRTLLTNGKFQGNDGAEMTAQIAFSLIPILHQTRRGRALVVGLGTGQSAAVVDGAGYETVEVAEISPGIVAAYPLFAHVNGDVLSRPEVSLALEDGRNHLLRSGGGYDLITMELSSVWFAGTSNLYSREFYRLADSKLAPGGLLQQWVQLHHIAPEEVLSIIATIRDVFPHVGLWVAAGQGVLVASRAPLEPELGILDRLDERPRLRSQVERFRIITGIDVASVAIRPFLEEAEVDRLYADAKARGLPMNSDANRFLEYATPRHNLEPGPHVPAVVQALLAYVPEAERRERVEIMLASR